MQNLKEITLGKTSSEMLIVLICLSIKDIHCKADMNLTLSFSLIQLKVLSNHKLYDLF